MIFPQNAYSQNIRADTALADEFYEKACILTDSARYDSAIVYYAKAGALYREQEKWRKYLLNETKHGICYQKQWKLDQATATIKSAIQKTLPNIGENDTIVADAYHSAGTLLTENPGDTDWKDLSYLIKEYKMNSFFNRSYKLNTIGQIS